MQDTEPVNVLMDKGNIKIQLYSKIVKENNDM